MSQIYPLNEAMKDNSIVTADINANSTHWYSEDQTDHRGEVVEDIVDNSNSSIINENEFYWTNSYSFLVT